MWNALTLPFAALRSLIRAVDLLEQAVAQAAGLNQGADEARELLRAGLERMDAMNERADLVLRELADAREVFAEAMAKVDRLSEQGDRMLVQIADAERQVDRLLTGRDDLVEAANAARRQLEASQATLAEANERFGRALEMAEPLDRMTTRAARIAERLRPGESG
jgi:chromosome segregation ATPase